MQFYEMCTVPVDHTLGMYGVLAVVLFVFNASAQRWDTSMTPSYNEHENQNDITYRMADNKCAVCLAEQECAPFNPLQCEYYMDTNKIFDKENKSDANKKDPELRSAIDTLVYSIIEEGKSEADEADCIPYVSKYTDCTKENICLGCKTCNCDKSGHWNCTFEAICRPELVSIIADKTVLETAMENLNKDSSRRKRSLYHSIRSIEEAHLEKNINDDYHDKNIFNQYEATSNNESPKDTNTLFEEIPNPGETDLTKKSHIKKGFIKLIVHSLIHDTLPGIFEDNNLDFENNRVKRGISTLKEKKDLVITTVKSILESVDFNTEDIKTPKNKITFDELSEWVNEVHPLGNVVESNYTLVNNTNDGNITQETIVIPKAPVSQPKEKMMTVSNPEYIAFEEVYSNIQVDNKTSVRRKPLLDLLDEKDIDIFDDKYYVDTISTSTLDSVLGNNILDGTDDPMTDQTKPSTYRDALNLQQPTELDIKNFDLDIGEVVPEINNSKINNLDASSVVNVMKRDVFAAMNNGKESYSTNLNNNATVPVNSSSISAMTISSVKNLRNGIFDPSDTLLENSQRDIKEILKLRDNLINFIRANRQYLKLNISNEDLPVHLKNLEQIPQDHNDILSLRRTNLTTYDKYLMKLKRDVNEVIRDVLTLKKLYKDPSTFPSELNFLIRSLKHYMHKSGVRPKGKVLFHSRRSKDNNSNNSLKNIIISTLNFLAKTKGHTGALDHASLHSKRLIRRIIKNNYVDELAELGLRVQDPFYNLTNDLRNVGSRWHTLAESVESSGVANNLHNLKSIHLHLSADVAKMKDALALINFASSRRMVPVDETSGENIVNNINENFEKIKLKIEHNYSLDGSAAPVKGETFNFNENGTVKYKSKSSFMNKIRKLVTNSKQDFITLLRKRAENKIVRKNIEEMTKKRLEGVMKKWQTDLNIISRSKRSNKGHAKISRRISNIIPKYLEGKVHPAMVKNKKDKSIIGHIGTNILKSNHTVKNLTIMNTTNSRSLANISTTSNGKSSKSRTTFHTSSMNPINVISAKKEHKKVTKKNHEKKVAKITHKATKNDKKHVQGLSISY